MHVVLSVGFLLFAAASCQPKVEKKPLESVGIFRITPEKPVVTTDYELQPGLFYLFEHVGGQVCLQGEQRCSPPRGSDVPGNEAWGLFIDLGTEKIHVRDRMVLQVEIPTPLTFFVPDGENLEYEPVDDPLYADNLGYWDIEVSSFGEVPPNPWVQGMTVTAYSPTAYCSLRLRPLLERLKKLGCNAVQYVVIFQTDGRGLFPTHRTANSYCLASATRVARSLGLAVSWNMHVEPDKGSWRGSLVPKDRTRFYQSYLGVAEHLAAMAQYESVDYFVPASELVAMASREDDRWELIRIFEQLHAVYFGTIAYGADRSEFAELGSDFWMATSDVAGLTAWYSLGLEDVPSVESLKGAWFPIVDGLKKLSETANMPVLLVEGPGYRPVTRCTVDPAGAKTDLPSSPECQANALQAFLETFVPGKYPFVRGYFLWEVTIPGEDRSDYSPLDLPAETVLMKAWKNEAPGGGR